MSRRTFLFKKTCRPTLHMASFLVAPSPTARSISTLSKLWKRILDVFFSPDYWFRLSVRPFWAFWKHFVEKKLEQRFTTFELSVNNSCACTVHSSRMNWRVNKLPLRAFFKILSRSLRVYILKQLFFSISVNSGFKNIYLAAFAAR